MTFLESIFLGLVQGLTEFLPISSSGHLILFRRLLGIEGSLFFDVMLHLGTLTAVLVMYRRQIWSLFTDLKSKKLLYLALASIPTFALAAAAKFLAGEEVLEKLMPIGFAATIVLLVLAHYLGRQRMSIGARPLPAIVCGVVQGVAVLPGLSRSGSTISTLRLFGVNKEDCAEFSFLLSVPVILASAAVETLEVVKTQIAVNWLNVAVGVVVAALAGAAAIKLVNKMLKNATFIYFAAYLVLPLLLALILL